MEKTRLNNKILIKKDWNYNGIIAGNMSKRTFY